MSNTTPLWLSIDEDTTTEQVASDNWYTYVDVTRHLDLHCQSLDIWRSEKTEYAYSDSTNVWTVFPDYQKCVPGICYRGYAPGMTHYVRLNQGYIKAPNPTVADIPFQEWIFGFSNYSSDYMTPKLNGRMVHRCEGDDDHIQLTTNNRKVVLTFHDDYTFQPMPRCRHWPYGKANAIHVKAK